MTRSIVRDDHQKSQSSRKRLPDEEPERRLDMSTTPNVTELLRAAVAARKDSLVALRARIADLLTDIPVGTKLSDEQGLVCRVARICTGASQWANRTWEVTIKGRGYVAESGRLIATEIDEGKWDGNNMHHHTSEPYFEGTDHDDFGDGPNDRGLLFAAGKDTRAIATRLPRCDRTLHGRLRQREASQRCDLDCLSPLTSW